MAWSKQEAIIQLPPGVQQAVAATGTVVDALLAMLNILRGATEALAALSLLELNASQLIIKAAVEAVETAIKDLVQDTGAYLLLVPAPRQTPLGDKVQQTLVDLGLKDLPSVPPYLLGGGDLVAPPNMSKDMASFWAGLTAPGGNAAFVRTVLDSLNDQGDPNRPQLSPTDYVAGVYLVAGAPELTALTPLIRALNAVFGTLQPVHTFERPGLPQPRGLRVKAVGGMNGLEAYLTWQQDDPVTNLAGTTTWALIHQVAILRSTKPIAQKSVLEIYGTFTPSEGDVAQGVEVINVIDIDPMALDPISSSYVDDTLDAPTVPPTNYYYALAYNVKYGAYSDLVSGGGTALGFGCLSSVEKLVYEQRPTASSKSTAPDWIRTPSVLALVPALSGFVNDAELFVEQLGTMLSGYPEMLKSYVVWLNAEIKKYEDFSQKTLESVKILLSLLNQKYAAGLYARSFSSQSSDAAALQGGNIFVARDLASAFSSEQGRPPFVNNEFVTGLVILAAAPSQAGLLAVKRALDLLFGAAGSQANVIQNAVNQIGQVVANLEQQFGSDLTPVPTLTAAPGISIGAADTNGTGATSGFTAPNGSAGSAGQVFPASLPKIGADDKGICPLLVRPENLPQVSVSFGPNMQPQT